MPHKPIVGSVTFLLIAFAMPWTGWFLFNDDLLSLWLYPMFVSLAGFGAAFAEGGKSGLFEFSRRVFAVVPAVPFALLGLVLPLMLGLSYLAGNGIAIHQMLGSPSAILTLSLASALVTGPIAEEFGWRGYLQYRLLVNFSPFWTALIVGIVWWLWHFALYRTSVFASIPGALNFLIYLLTWSIFMVFLVSKAGGSVWPAVVLHWAANTHPNVMQALLPSVDSGLLPGGSQGAIFYLAVACLFVVVNFRFYFGLTKKRN